MNAPVDVDRLADELLAADDHAQLIDLPSERWPGLTLDDAYAVASRLRERRMARGETPRGYKIGFTNRGIWPRYNVYAPIWAPVWSSTLTLLDGTDARVSLQGLVQPRLEPEIVFGFAQSPRAGMSEAELAGCIEWVAHGFEIVHTHCADWRFTAPDTVVDFALHGRLLVGPRVPIDHFQAPGSELAALQVQLSRDGGLVEEGQGRNVLDGPLNALRLWVDTMARQTPSWPICPGDVVTTGTLTDAWPIRPGQTWATTLSDPRLPGLKLETA
jgi:2-oxo-3-hexenedioate decarboxylase